MNEKQELKEIYTNAVKLNNLKPIMLQKLHKATKDQIEKWLYVEGRFPDFRAVYELYLLIKRIKGILPQGLVRVVMRSTTRADEVFKILGLVNVDGVVRDRRDKGYVAAYTYILSGRVVTLAEISMLYPDLSKATIILRLKKSKIEPGGDVSNVSFARVKPKYLFKVDDNQIDIMIKRIKDGESISDICIEFGISKSSFLDRRRRRIVNLAKE